MITQPGRNSPRIKTPQFLCTIGNCLPVSGKLFPIRSAKGWHELGAGDGQELHTSPCHHGLQLEGVGAAFFNRTPEVGLSPGPNPPL